MRHLLPSALLAAGLLTLPALSDQQSADTGSPDSSEAATAQSAATSPPTGNPGVLAAMSAQLVGKNLAGKLMAVDVDGGWVEATLDSAPEYYLAYYSASW
jgi:hypothetical protein